MSKTKIIIIVFVIVLMATFAFLATRRIDEDAIIVKGNEKYTDEEIKNYIFVSKKDKNPYYLYFKSRFSKQKTIPFVDKYKIKIKSMDSVEITVYEKSIIGRVKYMGSNMYFDKDGTVVESSSEDIESVPEVKGLEFESIVLMEELPVEDKKVLDMILDTTQLLTKYEINVDSIYVKNDKTAKLIIGGVTVELGDMDDMNDKMRTLKDMLPNLEGQTGTLNLQEYNEDGSGYTFKKS